MGDIKIEWTIDKNRVTAISGSVPVTSADQLPTAKPSSTPGVKLDINFGRNSREDEVEEAIRTVWGLLSLFAFVEIDLAGVETSWIAENEDERARLEVFRFSRSVEKTDPQRPRRLRYDLVARATAAARAAAHYEIPLGFLRRGTRALHNGQYIDAFYSLFFFLETLFAPGYSKPSKVKKLLWDSKVVRDAVAQSRAPLLREGQLNVAKRDKLLAMTDEQLLYHLVSVRGTLHHHALGRPGIWHPDKADHFREEAILLHQVVHSIAVSNAMSLLFARDRDEDLLGSARRAGAIMKVRIEASGLIDGTRHNLQPFVFTVPSRHIDRAVIDSVHRRFREQFAGGPKNVHVLEYKLMSEDASLVYAVWRRSVTNDSMHHYPS